jgi:hypothetical protein
VKRSFCHQGASTYLPFQQAYTLIRKNQLVVTWYKVASKALAQNNHLNFKPDDGKVFFYQTVEEIALMQ